MSDLREQILQTRMGPRRVEVPEWPGIEVYIRPISAKTREEYEQFVQRTEDYGKLRAKLCAMAICDAEGNRTFDENKDLADLADLDSLPIERIFDAVTEMNGMGKEDLEEAGKG